MEASQILQRRLVSSLARSFQCQCSLSAPTALRPQKSPLSRRRQLAPATRPLSTSRRRQQDASTDSAVSSETSIKKDLKSFISSVNRIIETHNLKSTMAPRQHTQLLDALISAETHADGPGQNSGSLNLLFTSLRGEVNPILDRQFGTTDLTTIRNKTPSEVPAQPPPNPKPQRDSISANLDSAFGPRKPRPERKSVNLEDAIDLDKLASLHSDLMSKSNVRGMVPESTTKRADSLSQFDKAARLGLSERLNRADQEYMAMNAPIKTPLRLKPSLGRQMEVTRTFDLTRAFRALEGLCARNSVKRDLNTQKFHVRRGQKKKNLRIDRWRKMFMDGFLAECATVRRMRKQGW